MFDPTVIDGFVPAFAAGALTSLHCVGMCGPLASAFTPACKGYAAVSETLLSYHAARVVAYTMIGALAGWVGSAPFAALAASPAHYFPWALFFFMLILGLGLDQRLPKPRWAGELFFRISSRLKSLPALASGITMGLLTPFLPCGPLYLIFGVALLAGSAPKGAEFALAFGMGTVPLLWLAQGRFLKWQQEWAPSRVLLMRRGLALVGAALVAVRLLHPTEIKPADQPGAGACPMCPSKS